MIARTMSVESLESRCVLAAYFPAYVDGQFTLGGTAPDGSPYGLDNTFLLATNPTADKTIYLDYNGHHSVNNSWGHDIVFPAFNRSGSSSTFSNSELLEIQRNFQNVAEDFAPFNVNVTTIEPSIDRLIKSNSSDQVYGVRSLQTQSTSGFGSGIGGVALLGSFDDNRDNPVFTFNKGANNGAMTISHEVGHALGLSHDGLNSQSYHPGTGSGETGWGPIMGAPFGRNVTQWSNGDYNGSTTTQNDVAIIANSVNGFGYSPDDHGDNAASATVVPADSDVFLHGVVGRRGILGLKEVDTFEFVVDDGRLDLQIRPFDDRPNLDVKATLTDSSGLVIVENNPLTSTWAEVDTNLAAGTYYLTVEGVGRSGIYSDYGSMGFYTIEGTMVPGTTTTGDFSGDGQLDVLDLDMLMADIHLATTGGGTPALFDLTGDNQVDLADRDAWLAAAGSLNLPSGLPYLVADANLDGTVDGDDFQIWNTNKFTAGTKWSEGNFNEDGLINGRDFLEWNARKFTDAFGSSLNEESTEFRKGFSPIEVLPEGPWFPLEHDSFQHGDDHGHGGGCSCPDCCAVVAFKEIGELDEPALAEVSRQVAKAISNESRDVNVQAEPQIASWKFETNLSGERETARSAGDRSFAADLVPVNDMLPALSPRAMRRA